MSGNPNIFVEVTDASEFHCFRLVLNPPEARHCETHPSGECDGTGPACVVRSAPGQRIEVMFHARSLVDLIHKCSLALCDWQAQTSADLLRRLGYPELAAPESGAARDPSAAADGDTTSDLKKPMRSQDEVQRAHDVVVAFILGDMLLECSERDRELLNAAAGALCWILRHDHNYVFETNLAKLEKLAEEAGFRLIDTGGVS